MLRSLHPPETHLAAMSWCLPLTKAEARAKQLLISKLSPAQREQYEASRFFDVVGGDTGKHYRIRHGCQMNVDELDQNGQRIRVLCFMPNGGLPSGDVMLAQKIALELFESEALRVANKSPWYLEYEERFGRRYRDHH
jgi:hypothetical protein